MILSKTGNTFDSYAIPFKDIAEAIENLQYATAPRIMFEMLFLTGCRLSELDNMGWGKNSLQGSVLYWDLGKNQTGSRKVELPLFYIREIEKYRGNNKVMQNKLFGISANTFRRYFTKLRQELPETWRSKRVVRRNGVFKEEYRLQLKGLRKSYQTLLFAKEYKKWNDASVALEITSKQMKHSSARITAYHYIENFEALDIKHFIDISIGDIMKQAHQEKLITFFNT